MTIEDFSEECGVSIKQLRKKVANVKGVKKLQNGSFSIPEGSRYPYNFRNSKLNTKESKIYALLEATNHYRYIDHKMLKTSQNSFKTMVDELVKAELLIENGSKNIYGAN